MRCQAASTGGACAGSRRNNRLDPVALPLRYTAGVGDDARRQATIFLDHDRAIIKSRSPIGVPLTICLPVSTFQGVAVHMKSGETGDAIEVTIELWHRDPALRLPLVVAHDPWEIVDDWQAWSHTLGLPLLLVDQDGSVVAVESPDETIAQIAPRPRRHASMLAGRRPRFLTRRKRGWAGLDQRLSGHEMIARD
jgi:Family of unknown function (DUF6101)